LCGRIYVGKGRLVREDVIIMVMIRNSGIVGEILPHGEGA
jgi:hypothetical protein